jgi:hypothetical protein
VAIPSRDLRAVAARDAFHLLPVGREDRLRLPATHPSLQARIARLERELQAPPSPPPQAAAPFYPAAPPPPAADYYPAPYYSTFGYSYPYAVFPVRVVRPAPRFVARRFASFHHGTSFHRGGGGYR